MAFPTVTVTPGTGQTVNTLPNAGAVTAANSLPVALATDQLSALATQTTLAALLANTPAPGQALAAASIPVVLTALQLSSLTAPVLGAGTNAIGSVTVPDAATTTGTITVLDSGSTVAGANTFGQVIVTGAATAGSTAVCTVSGNSSVDIQMVLTGTTPSVTLVTEKSIDGGVTWREFGLSIYGSVQTTLPFTIPSAQTVVARSNVAATTKIRLRCTATSGSPSLVVTFQPGYGIEDVSVPGGVNVTANTAGGTTTYHNAALGTAPTVTIKSTPGQLYALRLINTSTTAPIFVKLYNAASNPTIGAGTIIETICVAAASSATQPTVVFYQPPCPVAFSTGIAFTITGALPDNDATAIGASGTCCLDAEYK